MEIRLFLQHYNSFETLICRARCTSRAKKMPEKRPTAVGAFLRQVKKIAFMFHPII